MRPSPSPTPVPCVAVSGGDFEGLEGGPLPVHIPGTTVSGSGLVRYYNHIDAGNFAQTDDGRLTVTFDTDQARMTIDWFSINPGVFVVDFEAFDSAGNIVATGSHQSTRTNSVGWPVGTSVVSGARLRKVVLQGAYHFDNLTASCN